MKTALKMKDETLVVKLSGELDHHAAKELVSVLKDELDYSSPVRCVLDFSGITFMDSSGLAVILFVNRHMRQCGGSFGIIHLPEQAARVVDASGIEHLIAKENNENEV